MLSVFDAEQSVDEGNVSKRAITATTTTIAKGAGRIIASADYRIIDIRLCVTTFKPVYGLRGRDGEEWEGEAEEGGGGGGYQSKGKKLRKETAVKRSESRRVKLECGLRFPRVRGD